MTTNKKLASAAAIAAALTVAAGWSTPAAATAGTYYSVLDTNYNPPTSLNAMVIGISGASTADRAQAILFHWQGDANQHWTKKAIGSYNGATTYEIINGKSGKCLDKSQDVPDADGNAVYQYTCSASANQLWYQVSANGSTSGWKELVNVSDGKCLDIAGPSYTNAAVLHVWHCYRTWSQQWNIDD